MTRPTTALRGLIADPPPAVAPDCYSALTARIVERAGFPAVYLGGQAVAAMHYALPDIGCLTTTEMLAQAALVCAAVDIPVIVDADEGGGSVAELRRTILLYERAGVAGLHLEDAAVPKHTAWRAGVVPVAELQARIAAAVAARTDPDLVIMSRSNVMQEGGTVAQLIERGRAGAEAGADVFVANGARGADLDQVVREVPIPVAGYRVPREEAAHRGIALVLYAGWAMAAAARTHERLVGELHAAGELPPEVAAPYDAAAELTHAGEYAQAVRAWAKATGRPVSDR